MLFRTLALMSHGVWSQKATSGVQTRMTPREQLASPSRDLSIVDFPLSTGLTIIVKDGRGKRVDISFRI
jgi:hypothetical protein